MAIQTAQAEYSGTQRIRRRHRDAQRKHKNLCVTARGWVVTGGMRNLLIRTGLGLAIAVTLLRFTTLAVGAAVDQE